jgi:histidinol-phosphate/aromatic aminotransferase/cobyric acid decarboxylase-like protein
MLNAEQIYSVLKQNPCIEVFKAKHGGWFLTHGKGQTTESAVAELLKMKVICRKYSDVPGYYHIGATVDAPSSIEKRKLMGRRAPLVYCEQPVY